MATTNLQGGIVSPVNIDARKTLGIKPGDTVRVWQKIEEKGKTRLQAFEGIVLAHKHGSEAGATFTVRRVSGGVGVEKIFPLYSPLIDKIEIVRRAKVRRAKLYYMREKVAKEIKRQMRNMILMDRSTGSDIEEKEKAQKEAEEAEAKQVEEGTVEENASKEEQTSAVKAEEKSKGEEKKEDEVKAEQPQDTGEKPKAQENTEEKKEK